MPLHFPWPREQGREVEGVQPPRTQLPPPPKVAGTAVTGQDIQKYKALPVFLPLPILGITAFKCISDDPLDLIKVIKSAATNFKKAHKDSDPKVDGAMKGANLLAKWLYTVHKDLIEETRLSTEPNNVELLVYAKEQRSKCLIPSLKHIARLPPEPESTQTTASYGSLSKGQTGIMKCATRLIKSARGGTSGKGKLTN